MPIYEYACEHCGVFEEMQRITDPPLAKCPKCKRKVRRLISQTSFQLKGSGWYVTDYARTGNGGAKKDDASGGASTSESRLPQETATSEARRPTASMRRARPSRSWRTPTRVKSSATTSTTAGAQAYADRRTNSRPPSLRRQWMPTAYRW